MTPALFETYIRIAKEQNVHAFKLDSAGMAVELVPVLSSDCGTLSEDSTRLSASGAWKRGPDLEDPDMKDWD